MRLEMSVIILLAAGIVGVIGAILGLGATDALLMVCATLLMSIACDVYSIRAKMER
jgi:hypothetical protein